MGYLVEQSFLSKIKIKIKNFLILKVNNKIVINKYITLSIFYESSSRKCLLVYFQAYLVMYVIF